MCYYYYTIAMLQNWPDGDPEKRAQIPAAEKLAVVQDVHQGEASALIGQGRRGDEAEGGRDEGAAREDGEPGKSHQGVRRESEQTHSGEERPDLEVRGNRIQTERGAG